MNIDQRSETKLDALDRELLANMDDEEDELLAHLNELRRDMTEGPAMPLEEFKAILLAPQLAVEELYDECFPEDPVGPKVPPSRSVGPSLPMCDWVQVGPKRPKRAKKTQGSRPVQGPELPLKQSQRFALLDVD